METVPKTDSSKESATVPRVEFAGDVLQQIRQHARSSMRAEICGVLIGNTADGVTRVTARIAGEGASQGGAHVTFTQDTWEHIYKVKDAEFSSHSIVGWYHSHPGFGIFLSDYDLFIHENFFNAQHQVAWVFDPHSDEEGCFGWIGKKVEPLAEIAVIRKHRPPDPEQAEAEAESHKTVVPRKPPVAAGVDGIRDAGRQPRGIGVTVIVAVLAFVIGFVFRPYFVTLKHAASAMASRVTARLRGPSAPLAPTAAPQVLKAKSGPMLPFDIDVIPPPASEKPPAAAPPTASASPVALPPGNVTDSPTSAGSTANPASTAPPPLQNALPETPPIEDSAKAPPAPQAEKPSEPKPKAPDEPGDQREPTPEP